VKLLRWSDYHHRRRFMFRDDNCLANVSRQPLAKRSGASQLNAGLDGVPRLARVVPRVRLQFEKQFLDPHELRRAQAAPAHTQLGSQCLSLVPC
jgi:hypothetical protein